MPLSPRVVTFALLTASIVVAAVILEGTIRLLDRYSYPDYVGKWLNTWGAARTPSVRFDVINTAREGIAVRDVRAACATANS